MTQRRARAGSLRVPGSRTTQHPLAARCLVRTAARDLQAARALVRALADGRRSERLKAAIRRTLVDYPELAGYVEHAERLAERSPATVARRLAAGRRRDAERDAAIAKYVRRPKGRKALKRSAADLKSAYHPPSLAEFSAETRRNSSLNPACASVQVTPR